MTAIASEHDYLVGEWLDRMQLADDVHSRAWSLYCEEVTPDYSEDPRRTAREAAELAEQQLDAEDAEAGATRQA